jgi:hypothetical protein
MHLTTPEIDDMAARESAKVNLDALIVRQDMEGGEAKSIPKEFSFGHDQLIYEKGWTQDILRKPDFQRSTSWWTPEKVKDMVVAYVEGETVPSLIVWRSPQNYLFVIDGAHRLSSVIAWINDDYGDGDISKAHYGESQNGSAAQKTRDLIKTSVGSYKDLINAVNNDDADPIHKANSKKLFFAGIPTQALEKAADAASAERSFLKINQQGVVLSPTEKWLIHARFCPNSMAARAISLQGKGGAYWERFDSAENKKKIAKLGGSVFKFLFTPDLDTGELKTVDLPIAGAYTADNALGLIFQFVNFANDVPTKAPNSRAEAETVVPIDSDGTRTIQFLKRAERAASLMSNLRKTNLSRSADLHPFVYFYSHQGNHQPTMFLATAFWLCGLDRAKKLPLLAKNGLRGRLENFLLANSFLVPSISRKARGEEKAVRQIKRYLDFVFEKLSANTPKAKLLSLIEKEFKVVTIPEPEDDGPTTPGSQIPIHVKNSLFIEHELGTARRCHVCKARIPARALSSDHRKKREHGGAGTKTNVGPTHHACNSAKDKIKKLEAESL